MKNHILILFVVSLLLCQFAVGQNGRGVKNVPIDKLPAKEKRWALIIGVSQYQDGNITPLPGANNDAHALRDALRDYAGFDSKQIITLTTDETPDRQPTKNNILRYLGNLKGLVEKDGLLFVAFSGHGIERQNRAFLLASDTPYNDNLKVLERTALGVSDDFKELIRDTEVGQVVILLDACRNDPSSGRSSSDNLLTKAYEEGFSFDVRNREVEAFATLYATSIGTRAYEYTRENKGYFTWAFIEGLKGGAANSDGEITLGALIRYVERYVPQQVKIDLGSSKVQKPFSIVEGYKAEQLVLGIANSSKNTSLSSAQIAWNNFRGIANNLMKYDYIGESSEGLVSVSIGEMYKAKWGFINENGQEVIPLRYDDADSFSEGLAGVELNNKKGFIDKTGKVVIPLKYDGNPYSNSKFSEGLVQVSLDKKSGFIDKTEQVIIPLKYGFTVEFSEGLAGVSLDDEENEGFIDKTGRIVIPLNYDHAHIFKEGLACVTLNEKSGFIDKNGKIIIPIKYDSFDASYSFSEGLASVDLNYKTGFINKTGKVIVPFKYDGADSFSEGLAQVMIGRKYGFIDKTGREVIALKYDYVWSFSNGIAMVKIGRSEEKEKVRYGFVNKTGREVIAVKYDSVWCDTFIKQGFVGITLNGKKGFVDIYGNEYFDL